MAVFWMLWSCYFMQRKKKLWPFSDTFFLLHDFQSSPTIIKVLLDSFLFQSSFLEFLQYFIVCAFFRENQAEKQDFNFFFSGMTTVRISFWSNLVTRRWLERKKNASVAFAFRLHKNKSWIATEFCISHWGKKKKNLKKIEIFLYQKLNFFLRTRFWFAIYRIISAHLPKR